MACMRNSFLAGVLLGGRYISEEYIHAGSFGMVFRARDTETGDRVAIKCLTKRCAVDEAHAEFAIDDSEELAVHKSLGHHNNIVNLVNSFETEAHLYLVLEYCERGDLYEAIYHNSSPIETEKVRHIMLQLVDAVEYIHSKNIFHRDIKPENIFLKGMTVKLGDFGLSTADRVSYEVMVGSDRYMAPEQCESDGSGYSPQKADIWAVGIVLLNLLFSKNPFGKATAEDPFFRDFCSSREALSEIFTDIGRDTYDVLEHCLNLNPAKRNLRRCREALVRAKNFTTLPEDEDVFLTGSPRCQATPMREPLGTPVLQCTKEQHEALWTEALRPSCPRPIRANRRTAAWPDHDGSYAEELFGESSKLSDWGSSLDSAQSRSLASTAGGARAGDGMRGDAWPLSMDSTSRLWAQRRQTYDAVDGPGSGGTAAPAPAPTTTTTTTAKTLAAPLTIKAVPKCGTAAMSFGKEGGARSWSEMMEEDEEMEEEEGVGGGGYGLGDKGSPERRRASPCYGKEIFGTFAYGSGAQPTTSKVEDPRGIAGPCPQAHSQPAMPAERTAAPLADCSNSGDPADGLFIYEPATPAPTPLKPRYSPPSKLPGPAQVDLWAALGERRRAYAETMQVSGRAPAASCSPTGPTSKPRYLSTPVKEVQQPRRSFGSASRPHFGTEPGPVGARHGAMTAMTSPVRAGHGYQAAREARAGQPKELGPYFRHKEYGPIVRDCGRDDLRDVKWRRDRRRAFGHLGWMSGVVEARS